MLTKVYFRIHPPVAGQSKKHGGVQYLDIFLSFTHQTIYSESNQTDQ